MLITEITKNHSYWHGTDNRSKENPYLDNALEWARHWDQVVDYYFNNEFNLSSDWLDKEEKNIYNNLMNIGFELYIGPKGKGVIDLNRNLLYLIDSNPYKPIYGIRSTF